MDAVRLGIMMIVKLSISPHHSPIGATLFLTRPIAKVPSGVRAVELIPFHIVAIGLLMGFAQQPWLTIR